MLVEEDMPWTSVVRAFVCLGSRDCGVVNYGTTVSEVDGGLRVRKGLIDEKTLVGIRGKRCVLELARRHNNVHA